MTNVPPQKKDHKKRILCGADLLWFSFQISQYFLIFKIDFACNSPDDQSKHEKMDNRYHATDQGFYTDGHAELL